MANYKDNNADLGNQTIEGTASPYELNAEIVMPDGSTEPILQTETADDGPVIIMAEPADASAEPIIMPEAEPIITPEAEPVITPEPEVVITPEPQAEPIITPATEATDDLDAQLAAMLGDQAEQPAEQPIVTPEPEAVVTPEPQP
ncbi:MAG: hypothetical protein K2I75_03200, partial [Clostridiales bacterium]|nr:hypothetical protein [Clostridiales bacterium]